MIPNLIYCGETPVFLFNKQIIEIVFIYKRNMHKYLTFTHPQL